MGALTLKPSTYQARPWELTPFSVFNYLEGSGVLVFHLRGGRVLKVTQSGWMRDRVRFAYDGFRRQRLTAPLAGGVSISWSVALVLLLGGAGSCFTFRVDPEGVHFFWLLRGYNFLRDGRGPRRGVSFDVNTEETIYHGSFGLKGVEKAFLVLPACLTLEEEQVLTPPTGGVSLFLTGAVTAQVLSFRRRRRRFCWSALVTPAEATPRAGQRALFQVSPLQGLLLREW